MRLAGRIIYQYVETIVVNLGDKIQDPDGPLLY